MLAKLNHKFVIDKVKKLVLAGFFIVSYCSSIAWADDCEEVKVQCAIPTQTRNIDGTDIERECWEYKYDLDCRRKSKDDCNKISPDCVYASPDGKDKCIEASKEGGIEFCSNYKRQYSCPKQIEYEEEKTELLKNEKEADPKGLICNALCLDGNCDAIRKAKLEDNKELSEAAAMINSLKNISKDIQDKHLVSVFKGDAQHCNKKITDYTNCCQLSGWGTSLGLVKCNPDDENLAKKRREKRCVEVGTHCTSKHFGKCIIEKTVFCCYDSIIAKILNQEAKKQLGLDNGTPEKPECGGIEPPEELEKVDFSKANFTEFYDEIVTKHYAIPEAKMDIARNVNNAEEIAKKANTNPVGQEGFDIEKLKKAEFYDAEKEGQK